MKRVEKPWGYEIWWAETDRYAGKILFIKAGHALSLQYHNRKAESMYCLEGEADLTLNDDTVRLTPGVAADIPVGVRHRLTALTDTKVVEVSTPELDDVVRLEDRYGREGTSTP
jgi:mannose-6-phosphate isomerase-like protein (cupin superfamily)